MAYRNLLKYSQLIFLWSAWDLKIWYSVIYQQRNSNCAVVFLSFSMVFLLLSEGFHSSPDTAFPWLNPSATVRGRIHELRSFSSVLQIIFNLSCAHHRCRHHRGEKRSLNSFFYVSKWPHEFKSWDFQKPAGCGNSTGILHTQKWHLQGNDGA